MNAISHGLGENADILPLGLQSIPNSPVCRFKSEKLGNTLLSDWQVIDQCNVQKIIMTLKAKHIVNIAI